MVKKPYLPPCVYTLHPRDLEDPIIQEWFENGWNHAHAGLPMRDDLQHFSDEHIAYTCGYHFAKTGAVERVP